MLLHSKIKYHTAEPLPQDKKVSEAIINVFFAPALNLEMLHIPRASEVTCSKESRKWKEQYRQDKWVGTS